MGHFGKSRRGHLRSSSPDQARPTEPPKPRAVAVALKELLDFGPNPATTQTETIHPVAYQLRVQRLVRKINDLNRRIDRLNQKLG